MHLLIYPLPRKANITFHTRCHLDQVCMKLAALKIITKTAQMFRYIHP
jgi:hypothetical protein